jgi:antitoxin component HigA of HigAB toxin-antitoxin module
MDLRQQLRVAITNSGLGLRELAREAGLGSHSQLSRYLDGKRDLTLENVVRLCKVLGLQLVPIAPKPAEKRKGK